MDVMELILVSVLLPFLLLIGWKLEGRGADAFAVVVMGVSLILNGVAAYEYLAFHMGKSYVESYVTSGTTGSLFGLDVDVASVLMGLTSILLAFLVVLYAVDYMSSTNRKFPMEKGKGRFYALLGLLTGASMLFIYSTNLIQFAVALELMAISMVGFIDFYGTARLDAAKAFAVLSVGVLLILGAAALLGGGQSLTAMKANNTALVLLMFAAFMMSSQLPFYSWLPDSTAAPIPASAYIHAASIVPLGAFMLFRIIQYMKPNSATFWILGSFAVALIVLMMIYYPIQREGKQLVSYSTMAQAGIAYLTLAYALLGHQAGLQIAIYQVINHAFVKALAFMSVGGFAYSLGTTNFDEIRGIRYTVPWASVAWFLSFFGLAGVLPLGLFFSKIFVVMVTHHAVGVASWLFPAMVLLDGAVFLIVTIVWFRDMFFGQPAPVSEMHSPKLTAAVMVTLILIGIVAPWVTINVVTNIGFMG
ncbi:proton-conducting transporter transmembrane domain-containing protein [Thermococcus sp.]